MDVIINASCPKLPKGAKLLKSESDALFNFLAYLGYDPLNPPYAELLSAMYGLEGEYLVVSPVHWDASHNDAMITASGKQLNLDEEESKTWFKRFSHSLTHDDMKLHYWDAHTWLLDARDKPPILSKPVNYVQDRPIMPELTELDPSLYWQKFLTQSQMFFASETEHSSVNGVWVWGGAKLDKKSTLPICADATFLAAAGSCSSEVHLYNPSVNLKEFNLLLLKDLNLLSPRHQEELKRQNTQWYWNETAYTSYNWFARLWRQLTHAH